MRMGVSEDLLTFMEAGRVAEAEGAAAVILHARTADMLYGPHARWDAIGELAASLSIPVIGNGDIFEAPDAVAMLRDTGCAGVMVGRACLGRPWMLSQTAALLAGGEPQPECEPQLRVALGAGLGHCRRLSAYWGCEMTAARQMRKFVPLYLMGYASAKRNLQPALLSAGSVADWEAAIATAGHDPEELPCAGARRQPRLKGAGPLKRQRVALPYGWLDNLQSDQPPAGAAADAAACEG
mmetsp:Transcript_45128/g.115450  ORF Transcript_45128/g.115450 Transcript_45128/m.115450 type:complete len:239 (+) Transcript_45128:133-849(+)